MKIFLIFPLIAFFFSNSHTSYAQKNFASLGAEWWHDDNPFAQSINRIHARVTGDTVIHAQIARKIEQTRYRQTWNQNNSNSIDTFPARPLFVYDTEDTVFIFNENFNRFTPLYIFNVSDGDTVCLPVLTDIYHQNDLLPNPFANGDTSFCFIVDSIRNVLYDTSYLKTIFQHSININPPAYNWSISEQNLTGAYAKRIGGLSQGLLPVKLQGGMPKPTQDTLTYQRFMGGFICYEEDSMSIHLLELNAASCYFENITNIDESRFSKNFFKISPNPTKGEIKIQYQTGFSVQSILYLIDLRGNILLKKNLLKGQQEIKILLKDYVDGVYFLRIHSNSENLVRKIVLMK